jgi:hypothetical protein
MIPRITTRRGRGLLLGLLLFGTQALRAQDLEQRGDLTLPEANAEIALAEDRGLQLGTLAVKSDGRTPKFTLGFTKVKTGRVFNLAATADQFVIARRDAHKRGGTTFLFLRGYVVNGNVYFAYLVDVAGPPKAPAKPSLEFHDVPAIAFREFVDNYREKMWKIVDSSTYELPGRGAFHTVVFHPR